MADAAVTARYAAKTLMLELLTKHELPSTATGQYNVESATRWIAAMVALEMFVLQRRTDDSERGEFGTN